MTPVATGLYQGQDPREVAAYPLPEAAHHLQVPAPTLRTWLAGHSYTTQHGPKRAAAVIVPAERAPLTLSFWNLVEAHVLASIRRHEGISLQKVRRALRFVENELDLKRPLIEQQFETDGVNLFVRHYGKLINASDRGQVEMKELLEAALRRIDRDPSGLADRLFPWSRDPREPRIVQIDPRRSFGRPVVMATTIPTDILAERFTAGESIAHLADEYQLDPSKIEGALRWELGAATAA
jgi:uncharacterized protein (DUF433 family)